LCDLGYIKNGRPRGEPFGARSCPSGLQIANFKIENLRSAICNSERSEDEGLTLGRYLPMTALEERHL
jgi:hypothetical protein